MDHILAKKTSQVSHDEIAQDLYTRLSNDFSRDDVSNILIKMVIEHQENLKNRAIELSKDLDNANRDCNFFIDTLDKIFQEPVVKSPRAF